jgi:quercetin dioxygenase-like cupin family protein
MNLGAGPAGSPAPSGIRQRHAPIPPFAPAPGLALAPSLALSLASTLWLASSLTLPFPAGAQDLVAVAPSLATVEHEDDRVRVVRLRIPAHAAVPMHDRPARVVVSLTANDVRLLLADGAERVTRTEAGTAAWSEPTVRRVVNLGSALENVVIELKQAPAAALPVAGPPTAAAETVLDDPWHRWAFENQYVRVYDVRIPPGVTSTLHRHAYDQVAVFVSGGRVASQLEGESWRRPATIAPRRVEFAAHGVRPIVHRVRNEGDAEFRVIVVQFLQ